MNEQQILDIYKNHTASYTCLLCKITKALLYKILDLNNILRHSRSISTSLSSKENENLGTTNKVYYNNGILQGRFLIGEQPEGWVRGALKFTTEQTETMLAKRGNRSPMQTELGKENYIKSVQAKYGEDITNPAQLQSVKDKMAQTVNSRYGVDYLMQNEEIKKKALQTCIDKYCSKCYLGSKECHEKYITKDTIEKIIATKRKNHTFNSSKPEEEYYVSLCEVYGSADIERNYNKDIRYPFSCDFYIKSLDLFIELNFHWTHGGMPYNEEDLDCKEKLALWQEKANNGSKYYSNAISTWTVRDVQKRSTALENKLNYLEIFSK